MSVGLDSWDSDSDLRWQSSTGNFRRWHILCTSIPPYGPSDVSCRHVESFTMASSTHTFMFRHVSTYRRLTNAEFLFLHSFPNSLSPYNFTSAFHKPFPTGSRERVWTRQKSGTWKKLPGLPPRWRSICSILVWTFNRRLLDPACVPWLGILSFFSKIMHDVNDVWLCHGFF